MIKKCSTFIIYESLVIEQCRFGPSPRVQNDIVLHCDHCVKLKDNEEPFFNYYLIDEIKYWVDTNNISCKVVKRSMDIIHNGITKGVFYFWVLNFENTDDMLLFKLQWC